MAAVVGVSPRSPMEIPHSRVGWRSKMRRRFFLCRAQRGADQEKSLYAEQNSLEELHFPVGTSQTHTLPMALSLEDAMASLQMHVRQLQSPGFKSGILRLQVPLPLNVKALHWVQSQPDCPSLLPRIYFSPRNTPGCFKRSVSVTVAGVGSAVIFRGEEPFSVKHWKMINRFLSEDSPLIRAYGAMRFNPDVEPSLEWEAFGTFYFFIPQVELCETGNCSILAVNLSWGDIAFDTAVQTLLFTLSRVTAQITTSSDRIHLNDLNKQHTPDLVSWHANVTHILQELNSSTDHRLSKAVMARQTKVETDCDVPPFTLLSSFQEQNPFAYQFCLQLPNGAAFIGNTPEQLFARDNLMVTSEAVAATRRRGATSVEDFHIGLDLLKSAKDHTEFQIVQEGVKKAMESVCKSVEMVMTKGIVKQPKVQHLCTRFVGEITNRSEEYQLLAALHPTAAVCGHPRDSAKAAITSTETFDRGLYAGPVGWFGGQGSEFAVGIRSALIRSPATNMNGALTSTKEMLLFAGVGIVQGSDSLSEWQELELKISQFEALLRPSEQLVDAANVNMLWASLIVEECCRLGVTCFCIAPGSRSSSLAEAAAANPRVSCVSCLDERALAFFAVGYGRGARKPAAVVTTSGTALSNLFPAVVEASQDCVPLLVLSADRPHELRDTGANQAINQSEHFGSFVRYHFDLPPATDEVPARMVLTTVDTAIFHATTDSCGPVHLNCPFREPLEAVPAEWSSRCLEGLSQWRTSSCPFTTYIPDNTASSSSTLLRTSSQMRAVTDILATAKRGAIVVGGLNHSQTTWAVYRLAEHLNWPVIPDVLSGLRLTANRDVNIIQNLDNVLLCPSLHASVAPDVILQIGSRVTSKRLSTVLQECSPRAYILVEEHSYRHDPGHRLTHRIKSSITEFTRLVLKEVSPGAQDNTYGLWLQKLSETVRREILFHIQAEVRITEPAIARIVSANVSPDSAVFLGNSMPIRDVDMYADAFCNRQTGPAWEDHNLPVLQSISANRGASGIDGVLSTAAGFAAGSKKRVTLLIGDLSFLHDTNGLMLLTGRDAQPPVTVVVVNNRGGGIFSLLPLSGVMQEAPFRSLISSEHDVQLEKLCHAHRLNHTYVRAKDELVKALNVSYSSTSDWVIEVESNIQENAEFHRYLQKEIRCHLDRVYPILSTSTSQDGRNVIKSLEILPYRFPLRRQVTTGSETHREGFLLEIRLASGFSGLGEIAPLAGLHEESLVEAKEQIYFLKQKLKGVELPEDVALLDGSFSKWLYANLGAQTRTIFPSVRTGLELAALQALASSKSCTFCELLTGTSCKRLVRICALMDDHSGTPDEVASAAAQLVADGYTALKLKVARRSSPLEDAAVVIAIRKKVGRDVELRLDANRRWTLQQATLFADAIRECNIQYLEEPVNDTSALATFLEESSIPVALDETIDKDGTETLEGLPCDNLVAAVIKPSRVGGFETANMLARLCRKKRMTPVISACFESSVSLSALAQFAAFIEQRDSYSAAHGLGTYSWTAEDIVQTSFSQCVHQGSISSEQAARGMSLRGDVNVVALPDPLFTSFTATEAVGEYCFRFHISEARNTILQQDKPTLLFLHGFLGSAEDWLPLMTSLAAASSFRCLAIDLPGHASSTVTRTAPCHGEWGMEHLTDALSKLLKRITSTKVVLVGYSMGARIALYMAARKSDQIQGVVCVSGSPGIRDESSRRIRALQDEELAESMRLAGLESFINTWYKKPLWLSLRRHPDFEMLKQSRLLAHRNIDMLAESLTNLSVGRQENLWKEMNNMIMPVLLVTGALDNKYSQMARRAVLETNYRFKLETIQDSGHCVHVECPLNLIRILREFANK